MNDKLYNKEDKQNKDNKIVFNYNGFNYLK